MGCNFKHMHIYIILPRINYLNSEDKKMSVYCSTEHNLHQGAPRVFFFEILYAAEDVSDHYWLWVMACVSPLSTPPEPHPPPAVAERVRWQVDKNQ